MDILAEGLDEDIIAWKDHLSPRVMLPVPQAQYQVNYIVQDAAREPIYNEYFKTTINVLNKEVSFTENAHIHVHNIHVHVYIHV